MKPYKPRCCGKYMRRLPELDRQDSKAYSCRCGYLVHVHKVKQLDDVIDIGGGLAVEIKSRENRNG